LDFGISIVGLHYAKPAGFEAPATIPSSLRVVRGRKIFWREK